MSQAFEVIVAGAGIAGLTAALTAARLGRRTMVLSGDLLGGQLLSIQSVDGFPGSPDGIPGYDLCPMAQEQAQAAGAEFSQTAIESLRRDGAGWRVATGEGDLTARAVIVATDVPETFGRTRCTRIHRQGGQPRRDLRRSLLEEQDRARRVSRASAPRARCAPVRPVGPRPRPAMVAPPQFPWIAISPTGPGRRKIPHNR